MLKFFRTKGVTKFVLWTLLILILPAFVLFGTEALDRAKKGPAFAGTIGKKRISLSELADSVVAVRSQLILNYGNQPDLVRTLAADKAFMTRAAWERLIMLNEAHRQKIRAADAEVVAYLRSHPLFIRNGRFDDKIYAYSLQYTIGMSARTFEEIIRKNIELTKLQASVVKDISSEEKEKRTKAIAEWLNKLSQGAKLNE